MISVALEFQYESVAQTSYKCIKFSDELRVNKGHRGSNYLQSLKAKDDIRDSGVFHKDVNKWPCFL